VRGYSRPELRRLPALAGGADRDYDYDIFWVTFPLVKPDGLPLFGDGTNDAELVVRIRGKEGHVKIPASIRARTAGIVARQGTDSEVGRAE
jgi:hypothetical protein